MLNSSKSGIPSSFNGYRVIGKLGSGTYGSVYRVQKESTGRVYAAKVMPMDVQYQKGNQCIKGLPPTTIREITALKDLCHPNIVKMEDFIIIEGMAIITMELMPTDLGTYMFKRMVENRPLSSLEIIEIVQQLLEAISYLHDRGLLHRDVKPQNVLYDPETRRVRLADMGLSRAVGSAGEGLHSNEIQTLNYRPPEVILGARDYGRQVDIWPVGVILYELLTNQPFIKNPRYELFALFDILRYFGTPTLEEFPEMAKLDHYRHTLPRFKKNDFKNVKNLGTLGRDLFLQMCKINPSHRPEAKTLLSHKYFEEKPRLLQQEGRSILLTQALQREREAQAHRHHQHPIFSSRSEQVPSQNDSSNQHQFQQRPQFPPPSQQLLNSTPSNQQQPLFQVQPSGFLGTWGLPKHHPFPK